MKDSQFTYLQNPTTIVLAAGHGGGDPGAVSGSAIEANQTITITNEIARLLRQRGLNVDVVPHEYGLEAAIEYINTKYGWDDAWALEIHRDSAVGVDPNEANTRCGVFGYGSYNGNAVDTDSMEIAAFMRDILIREGASSATWAMPDDSVRFGRLGWIRDVVCASHLLELGFIQGDGSLDQLNQLARWAAAAIYEAFTDQKFNQPTPQPEPQPTSSGTWYIKAAKQAQANIRLWNNKYITTDIKEAIISKPNFELLLAKIIQASSERDAGKQPRTALIPSDQVTTNSQPTTQQTPTEIVDSLGTKLLLDWGPNKNFFTSKKVWITLLSNLLSFGLVIIQTSQIKASDDWHTILIKLSTAALAALGISTVANQYVKVQGGIDQTTVNTIQQISTEQNRVASK